jgi:hypothetical protein
MVWNFANKEWKINKRGAPEKEDGSRDFKLKIHHNKDDIERTELTKRLKRIKITLMKIDW